ncbi:hypothetical protein ACIRPQ_33170 [Streptomyces sp. NPDC101213]|uniref:hypothetical protein n=1 Tax=Streptomyces sp. NPDC101213 TaxID=3366130 RepID=UPI00380D716E
MVVVVLLGVLALVVAGCVCVVWAARGGPRWARVVAAVTLAAAGLLRAGSTNKRTTTNGDD